MKTLKNTLLIILFSILVFGATAQSKIKTVTVSGYVIDDFTKEPMIGALVIVDTIAGTGVITDADGLFEIPGIQLNVESELLIEYVGYYDLLAVIKPTTENFKLSEPIAITSSMTMKEVMVYGTARIMEIKGDTTQYNAGAYKTNPDATAADLIAKMPGFKQSEDGSVSKEGETITKVLVDGRNYFRDDVAMALSSLPANIVESIQYIDDKSDESKFTGYDDGTRVKTINIVTTTKQKSAYMGEYYAGFGTDGRFMAAANTNIFTQKDIISLGVGANNINMYPLSQRGFYGGGGRSGISDAIGVKFNYDRQIKDGSISVTYMYNRGDKEINSLSNQDYLVDDRSSMSLDSTNTISNSHRVWLYYEQKLNANNKLIIRPNFSFSENTSVYNRLSENVYTETPSLDTKARTLTNSNSVNYSINPSIMWFHNFSKNHFLTSSFRGRFSNNETDRFIESNITTFDEGIAQDSSSIQDITDIASSNNIDANLAYTFKFGKYSGVNLRYNMGYDWSDNEKKTYVYDDMTGGYVDINDLNLNDDLSNTFARNYLTNTVSLGYSYNEKGIHVFNGGIGLKNSSLQNNMIYPTSTQENHIFNSPDFRMNYRYKISATSNFNVFLNGSSSLPSITQLQDVLDVSDPLNVSIGNPDLDQSFRTMLMAYYRSTNKETLTSFSSYFRLQNVMSSFATAREVLTEDTYINGVLVQKGAQKSTTVNLDGYWNFTLGSTFAVPIKAIKSSFNADLRYNLMQSPSMYNNVEYKSLKNSIDLDLNLVSNISPNIDFTVGTGTMYSNAISDNVKSTSSNAITQDVKVKVNWIFLDGFFINVDYKYRYNYITGSPDLDPHQNILNAAIGKKFFNNKLELRISAFDILNQYRSITYSQNDIFSQNVISNNLTQYFSFSLQYKFNTLQKGSDTRSSSPKRSHGGMRRRFS